MWQHRNDVQYRTNLREGEQYHLRDGTMVGLNFNFSGKDLYMSRTYVALLGHIGVCDSASRPLIPANARVAKKDDVSNM